MIVDLITILHGYGVSIVDQIRQNIASSGTNATGKTAKSLRYEVKEEGSKIVLRVLGRPFIKTIETGRKATPQYTKPSYQFVQSIKEWAKAKGLPDGSAYAIAKSIHKKGIAPSGNPIFSSVINESLTEKIAKDSLNKFANTLLTNVKEIYGRNSN